MLGTRQRLVIIAYIYDVKQQSGDMWGVVTMVVTGFLNVSLINNHAVVGLGCCW